MYDMQCFCSKPNQYDYKNIKAVTALSIGRMYHNFDDFYINIILFLIFQANNVKFLSL